MTLKEQLLDVISQTSDTPDKELLANTLVAYVSDATHKFLRGYKEHKGSIMDRPLLQDLKEENIDTLFYISAIETKRNLIIQELQTFYLTQTNLQGSPYPQIKHIIELATKL